ncbi:hypothetical protein DL96DRAFT_1820144 [Flagelloscypha sp. PMI_526]|nr:hypothetical protein DL96DRAFT_1820144 [Flagelloscypha sp. PMI_526]
MPPESSSRPAPTRKRHTSSRIGCLTCKTRHVKCDEVRPVCKACSRRRTACVWQENLPGDLLSAILPRVARAALKVSTDHQLSLSPLSEFRPKELELLHNWTTNTLFTFIPDFPAIRYGFQVSLPQIAFQNEFLLHATFAITSLHMHHLLPSSDYLPRAKVHCQHAVLGVFQAQKDSVSPAAVLMANILLATYWLASPAWESTHQSYFPDVFNWVPAARTFMRSIGLFQQDLLEGSFSFLPPTLFGNETPLMSAPFPDVFYQICNPVVCPFDVDELKDAGTLAAYELAVHRVSNCCWMTFMDPRLQILGVYSFLSTVTDEFIRLFLEHRSRALILVAHYCAILGQLDGVWWYSWERCRHDLQRILSLLDEKWLPCMEYPLNVMAMKDQISDVAFDNPGDSISVPETTVETGSPLIEEPLFFGPPRPSHNVEEPLRPTAHAFMQ